MRFLTVFSAAAGVLALSAGVLAWLRPRRAVRAFKAFPRCRWAGWLLCAGCVAWIVLLLRAYPLGMFAPVKPWLVPLGVLVFAAVAWGLGELLAVRALGGLLLLAASPVLAGLHFAEDPPCRVWMWHNVAAGLVYAWILLGGLWLLRPWTWRTAGEWLAARPRILRLAAATAAAAGAALLAMAFDVAFA